MPFSSVIGQDRATGVLSHALDSGRVAHAYLLYGPAGSGARAAALALGQALVCERRGVTAPAGDACGQCSACERASRLAHPDLHVYLPFPRTSTRAGQDDRPGDYAERLELLAADPYAPTDYRARAKLGDTAPSTKNVEHRRGPVEEFLRHEMAYVPVEGQRTVGVVVDADRMRVEAANSFLKLLEEPGPLAVLILTAERLDAVLPTILSRCQQVRFDPLAHETVEAALVARGVEPARAAFVARMADGSFTRALELVSSEALAEERALALTFLRAAYSGLPERLSPVVDQAAALGREPLRRWLGLVLAWVRDLVLARAAGSAAPIVNVDQAAEIAAFVTRLPDADLDAMAHLVEEAAATLAANTSPALVLAVLGHALADAMRGRGDGRLVTPLVEVG